MAIMALGQAFAVLSCVVVSVIALWIYFRSNISKCESDTDLIGKTVIVTGANCGIGYYTALDLAKRNARVILACRNEAKAQEAGQRIRKESGNEDVVVRIVDVSLMSSVRSFCKRIVAEEERLDILVNNAGIISTSNAREMTDDGFEKIYATNHFGPFLLTNLLLDLMKKSSTGRIVTVSSIMNKYGWIDFDNLHSQKSFTSYRSYSDSKLANILFTRELARKLEGTGITANVLHPGTVNTEAFRYMPLFFRIPMEMFFRTLCKTGEEGAQTSIFLAVSDDVKDTTGKYFTECSLDEKGANPFSRDMVLAAKLWKVSEKLTSIPSL